MSTLHDLANLVCKELPEDWELVISMVQGASVVNLYDPDGMWHEHATRNFEETLDAQVLQALGYAKATEREPS